MKDETKTGLQKAGSAVGKAGSTVGKAAGKSAVAIKSAATDIADRIREENIKAKLKKLNPLFPEEYRSDSFHLPNQVKLFLTVI